MTDGPSSARIATVVGLVLSVGVWGYVAAGPAGVLPRPSGPGLPMPTTRTNDLGSAIAEVDAEAWAEACEALGLPSLPDPTGIEMEPIRLLVEASRRWGESGDGDELGRMGEIALALELHESALDLFAAARELGSDEERWAYLYGAECQVLGRTRAALAALESARELKGDYGTTHARIGALHFDLGELELADESYARAVELAPVPSSAAGLVGRARVALEARDFDSALGYLDDALRKTPRDFIAHRLRSQALAGLGRLDDATAAAEIGNELPIYRGWVSFDPRLAEVHNNASTQRSLENALNVALGKGDLTGAIAIGEKLLVRLPKSPAVLSMMAQLLGNTDDLPRALELATAAVELDPTNLGLLAAQAEVALAARETETAARAAEAMLSVDPRDALAHQILGRIRYFEGRPDDALAELRQAIQLDGRNPKHRLMLIDVLTRLDSLDQAENELRVLLQIDPENAEAKARLDALRSGR